MGLASTVLPPGFEFPLVIHLEIGGRELSVGTNPQFQYS